jgi:tetratricopeptide (TPR) repeat protein
MEARTAFWLVGSLAVGLTGCTRSTMQANLAPTTQGPPPAVAKQEVVKAPIPQHDFKPETMCAIGDVQLELAQDTTRLPTQRDQAREQARLSYNRALKLDAKCVRAYRGLAQLALTVGDRQTAAQHIQQALQVAPNDATLHNDLGTIHAMAKDWNGAVSHLHKATQLDAGNLAYRKTLGFTLVRAGQYDAGYEWLSRAMTTEAAHYNMARMLHTLGHGDQAQIHLTAALEANPDLAEALAFRAELSGTANVQQASFDPNAAPEPSN